MIFKKNHPLILLIILHLILLTQLKFTVWPEMVLYPYFLLNDFFLYKDIINPYFPFLPIVSFGFFKLFGLSILNLKLLTWLIILITDTAVIYAAKHFFKKQNDQIIVLISFILLQIYFGGNALWFELMLTPFILTSLVLVYFYPTNLKKTLISGLLFSLAVLIKQNVILFLIPVMIFYLFQRQFKPLIYFILITFSILLLCALVINFYSLWNDFFTWAIKLPLSFTKQNGFVSMPSLRQYPLIFFPLLVIIPFLVSSKNKIYQKIFWLISFLIALQFAFPRYENFHLQVLAAFSSIFAPQLPKKYLIGFIGVTVILFGSFIYKNFHQNDRFIDSDMLNLSEKIKEYPSAYILNGSDLSYFFAGKLPPKPWAINFPWYFEFDNFEDKFTGSIREQKTEYIVIGDPIGGGKYDLGNYFPTMMLKYIEYNYNKIEKFQNYTIWQIKSTSP